MLREGAPIGVFFIWREEVRPFTDKQIELVTTFADQAVIAIENVRLFQELETRNAELTESLEQQTATAEILRVIASSPTDLQPVMEAVAENAARVCGATDSSIYRLEGEHLRIMARHGTLRRPRTIGDRIPINRGTVSGRVVGDRRTIHVEDILAAEAEFPGTVSLTRQAGSPTRTLLATPLLREGTPLGAILISRGPEVRPFTAKQIALLETFANQAVIAIENVRLFQELEARNAELTESLEQQTATSEILRVISSSPTDVQPVFDTIVASAVRLCSARMGAAYRFDGQSMHLVAHHNYPPEVLEVLRQMHPRPPQPDQASGRAILTRAVAQIEDMFADPEYRQEVARAGGWRSILAVPMLRDGAPTGAIVIARSEAGPFAPGYIDLLKTFADQAVIAIENVRLFQELEARNAELTETLEQQTATSEILRVIASSPTDLQPVMEAVAENAARVCGAADSSLYRLEGEYLRLVARRGSLRRSLTVGDAVPFSRDMISARAMDERRTIQVEDILAAEAEFPVTVSRMRRDESLTRTVLVTPLLREGTPLGVIIIARGPEPYPFSTKQIALLETFADQAVIAIENVRLFKELQARTGELTQSVEQLTALGEVGRAVSSTLDVETVLDTIVSRASQLAGADGVLDLRVRRGGGAVRAAGDPQRDADVRRGPSRDAPPQGRRAHRPRRRDARAHPDPRHPPAGGLPEQRPRHPHPVGVPRAARRAAAARGSDPRQSAREPQGAGSVRARGHRPPEDVRDPVGAGDRERAPVPRDRGQEPPARGREPAQVGLPGQHVPRAADAAQRDPRLQRDDSRRGLRRGAAGPEGAARPTSRRAASTCCG